MPAGRHVITVHVQGYAPELVEIDAQAGEITTVQFDLREGRQVSGVVKDGDGQPVAGAYVDALVWRGHRTLGMSSQTDEQGRFVLHHAPADRFAVDIQSYSGSLYDQVISDDRHVYEFTLQGTSRPSGPANGALSSVSVGQDCPAIDLVTMDGQSISDKNLIGKYVLIDFWATWCGPCVQEIPVLKEIYAQHGQRADFMMIGISSDFQRQKLSKFVKDKGVEWPQVYALDRPQNDLGETFAVRAIPYTALIDPQGKIIALGLTGHELKDRLDTLFEK